MRSSFLTDHIIPTAAHTVPHSILLLHLELCASQISLLSLSLDILYLAFIFSCIQCCGWFSCLFIAQRRFTDAILNICVPLRATADTFSLAVFLSHWCFSVFLTFGWTHQTNTMSCWMSAASISLLGSGTYQLDIWWSEGYDVLLAWILLFHSELDYLPYSVKIHQVSCQDTSDCSCHALRKPHMCTAVLWGPLVLWLFHWWVSSPPLTRGKCHCRCICALWWSASYCSNAAVGRTHYLDILICCRTWLLLGEMPLSWVE